MDETTTELIKSISSSYVRAQGAQRDGNNADELHHLLLATRNVLILLHHRLDDLDRRMATSYSRSLISSAERINELITGAALE